MTPHTRKTVDEISSLAFDVYESLLKKYLKNRMFTDSDYPQRGLILSCAGSVAVLLLANNFESVGKDPRWQEIIISEFDYVDQYLATNGYDATPFVTHDNTEKLFSATSGYDYTDSLSWVLSFGIQIRVAAFRLRRFDPGSEFMERVHNLIRDSLTRICDAACESGGWNFTNGCTKPHLYYSFAVTESLADFGDYVLGETPAIFNTTKEDAPDRDLCRFLTGPLVKRVNDARQNLLEYLWETYRDQLREKEIEPAEISGVTFDSKYILLYYTYFVIEMLVTCNLEDFRPEWEQEINDAIEQAIYVTRLDLARARADKRVQREGDAPWFDDPDKSTLWLYDWSTFSFPRPELLPSQNKLKGLGEPGLIPLSVRCNAQYAYYVAKGRDSHMGKLFDLLLSNRSEENGLWDSETYNLLITERAVEAIVDYCDYLREYETPTTTGDGVGTSKFEAAFREIVRDEIGPNFPAGVPATTPESATPIDIHALLSASLARSDTKHLLENETLKLLTSVLTKAQKHLLDGTESSLNAGTLELFQRTFREFLTALFFYRLKEATPTEEQASQLRKSLEPSIDKLCDALGPLLGREAGADLGSALLYMIDQSGREQEKLLQSEPAKRPVRGSTR